MASAMPSSVKMQRPGSMHSIRECSTDNHAVALQLCRPSLGCRFPGRSSTLMATPLCRTVRFDITQSFQPPAAHLPTPCDTN